MKARAGIIFLLVVGASIAMTASTALGAEPIKIGIIQGLSGPLEIYGKAEVTGFKMGLEYFTKGTNQINGRDVTLVIEDTQLQAARAKMLLTKLYSDDKVDLAIGPTSSGVALAVLPVARDFKKILIVEPAVADSITGKDWNRYVFRTGRNSSQDAISNAAAVAKPGVSIACIGQDYAFGRDGIAAYKEAAEKLGAKIVHEEYCDPKGTDFVAPIQRIIEAMKDLPEPKFVWVIWAGKGGPIPQLISAGLDKYGIEITSGGNVLAALKMMKPLDGMQGATYYYYENPKNPVNDWLVEEHFKRFGDPPDFFTCGGFAAAGAVVKAITAAGSTDTEKLIAAMEGMEFMTPKGTMKFRKEDHQALQTMFAFKLKVDPDVEWAIPVLTRELTMDETAPPIANKK
ncbi:amino acid/amide ABC transporter substrate-binding protein, HAAT family [Desulfatibacillum alkenivorans DSM 16219]|jgi:branched-chain amino acid transport system substrate-binding protein|uniref:Amino acid/amide ABC transporter substrate-binding protein, HAAT family n=1 Tax=Desulfatibacillum alkenivorans DSM 16219 TaxID=1121393 RepID=A0A1M6YK63_9BACT|nr:substrate-binding domain-containing protein [Desulfatibacillum alkenivorans]SHL18637.1 amino acid/amide ABC transporter substrate-binding protein, HAAT family [Desulfatibacillum alkenivorans DSM 16219]